MLSLLLNCAELPPNMVIENINGGDKLPVVKFVNNPTVCTCKEMAHTVLVLIRVTI